MVLKYTIAREKCFGAGAAYWAIHQVVTEADPVRPLERKFFSDFRLQKSKVLL